MPAEEAMSQPDASSAAVRRTTTQFPHVAHVPANGGTVVVVTGAAPLHPEVLDSLPTDAIVLAADGGLDHARAAGLVPAGLIGDLDSVSSEGLAWAQEHATIQRHPTDKDRTDTELAVAFAAAMGPERLLLVAGGGDRLDHTFSAIGSLGAPELTGVPVVECWWGAQRLRVVHGPGRATVTVEPGATVSLLALHGPCTGVTVNGTKWELDRVELPPLSGLGVSNVAVDEHVHVAVSLGVLTVFVGIDDASQVAP
jgi:thiamine pyrophosphokinase